MSNDIDFYDNSSNKSETHQIMLPCSNSQLNFKKNTTLKYSTEVNLLNLLLSEAGVSSLLECASVKVEEELSTV